MAERGIALLCLFAGLASGCTRDADEAATAATTAATEPALVAPPPPPPPPPPQFVDAYIGYVPMPDMTAAAPPGQAWYRQNALQVVGAEIRLQQSAVSCENGTLSVSESDGGSFWYRGSLEGKEPNQRVRLVLDHCDHCIEPPGGFPVPPVLAIAFPDPRTVVLDGVRHSKDTRPYSLACPPPG
jgi:hypothetical protein